MNWKRTFKILSVVAVVLFLTGIIVTAYYLFILPDWMIEDLKLSEAARQADARKIALGIKIIVGVELTMGLAAVLMLIQHYQRSAEEQVVYVNSVENKAKQDTGEDFINQENDLTEIEVKAKKLLEKIDAKADIKTNLDKIISEICGELEASQGAVFIRIPGKKVIRLVSSFAYHIPDSQVLEYEFGEGLTGQVAKEGKLVAIEEVPSGYIKILSGLGSATPNQLIITPLKSKDRLMGVMEISSFVKMDKRQITYIEKASFILGEVISKDKSLAETEKV